MPDLYLNPHQTRESEPTPRENAIGDVIERCYAAGIVTASGLVAALNEARIEGPSGQPWTEARFVEEMARLGA